MTHASICSGLDGPALAASWLGWENLFHADINEFTNHILKYHYPNATHYTDIRKTDFTEWRGKVDVLSAGFPCQPFSVAGKRTGQDHDSYLWPETLRVVSEVRPRWFIGENVNGITSMVFPGEEVKVGTQADLFRADREVYERVDRYIIDRICRNLEQIGYEVQPVVIPACAVGAPHERMRVFFLCYDATHPQNDGRRAWGSERCAVRERDILSGELERSEVRRSVDGCNSERTIAGTISARLEKQPRRGDGRMEKIPNWANFPTQSPVCRGDDGLSDRLSREAVFAGDNPARRKSTFNHWREKSIEALGNAIVPQVIYEIYRLIEIIENQR